VYNASKPPGVNLLTNVGHLDPIRRKMLEDMGIDVWVLREPDNRSANPVERIAPDVVQAGVPVQVVAAEVPNEPVLAPTPIPIPTRTPTPTPTPRGSKALAVTYLVSQAAVMLIDNEEPGISRRLCRDLLASVSGDWTTRPREIAFSWPGGGSPDDGWRAFKAFVDKQLGESQAPLVICSDSLAAHLSDFPANAELLVLPVFTELDAGRKRELWHRMAAVKR
jgi:hypothetical protein